MPNDRFARVPGATYRLQLRAGLGFRAVRELVPHLRKLGITDVYLSPVFQARRGSTHGYDVTDPTRLDRELGSPRDFEALAADLKAASPKGAVPKQVLAADFERELTDSLNTLFGR